jgi:type IV secretion system protein TrbJ
MMDRLRNPWVRVMAAALACLLVLPFAPLNAQFGIPQIVFDPTSYAQIVTIAESDASLIEKALEEIAQLSKIYQNGLQIYNLAFYMSQQIKNKNFAGAFSLVTLAFPANNSGLTGPWGAAINYGIGADQAWNTASMTMRTNPFNLPGAITGSPFFRTVQAHYASADLMNGSGIASIQAIGQVRAAQLLIQAQIQQCETDAVSGDGDDNTEIAQANITNGCLSLLLRQSQSQITLQTAHVDLSIAQMKRENDMLVQQLNNAATAQMTYANGTAGEPGGDLAGTVMHVDR